MKDIFYRCEICGNIVGLIKSGGGTLVCCDQEMTKLLANTVDASKEKHVPAVSESEGKIKVDVGSALHPMVPEHYIEWIALVTDSNIEIAYLKPGMEPRAQFTSYYQDEKTPFTTENEQEIPNCEGQPCNFVCRDRTVNNGYVYAYCNLHGLWVTEL